MGNSDFVQTIQDSFLDVVDGTVEFLPRLLVALLLLIVGFILAKYISHWLGKALGYLENSKPVKNTTSSLGVKEIDVSGIITIFVRWAVLLIFIAAAVDVLGLAVLTDTFNAILGFIPNILAAIVVAALSFVAANALYEVVSVSAKKSNIKAYKFLANAAKVIVLVFGLPLAAAQLGLDLTILTNNITVVVAGIMLAFGLSFGLGGKETAGKIVSDLYKNWNK
ncbi:hypothetical protein KDA00_02540 [Candidatus Saccharibacteria bacterium]|nr:hypothetical protein [Candidatus Saccharibacteria bacterium]